MLSDTFFIKLPGAAIKCSNTCFDNVAKTLQIKSLVFSAIFVFAEKYAQKIQSLVILGTNERFSVYFQE